MLNEKGELKIKHQKWNGINLIYIHLKYLLYVQILIIFSDSNIFIALLA